MTNIVYRLIALRIQDVYAEWGGLKQAIFLVYTSVRGRATDSMGFVEGSVCPDLVSVE